MQISHYEQTAASAFSLHHDDDDSSIASWDVSPSCDYVAVARSSGAVSLLTVSPRGSINHTRKEMMPFHRSDLARVDFDLDCLPLPVGITTCKS